MSGISKSILFLTSIYLLSTCLISQASAEDSKFSTSLQSGERRTSDVITESIDYYSFYRYTSRLKAKSGPLTNYYLKYDLYQKDFDTQGSQDNRTDAFSAGMNHLLKNDPENKLKMGLDLLQRNKNYKNASASEYRQTKAKLNFRLKTGDFSPAATFGINYFDYSHADKNQLDIMTKVETNKYFLDRMLKLKGFFGLTNSERDDRDNRIQLSEGLRVDLRFRQPIFKLLRFQIENKESDTKDLESEDRDDAYIFDDLRWYVRTEHKLTGKISTSFKYENKRRDYLDYNLDYSKYKVENSTKFQPLNTKDESFYCTLKLGHKEEEFSLSDSKSKIQTSAKIKCTYNRKESFKLGGNFGVSTDEYGASVSSNRKTYRAGLGFEKKFGEDVSLDLGWKCNLRDYKYKGNEQYQSFKAGVTYSF